MVDNDKSNEATGGTNNGGAGQSSSQSGTSVKSSQFWKDWGSPLMIPLCAAAFAGLIGVETATWVADRDKKLDVLYEVAGYRYLIDPDYRCADMAPLVNALNRAVVVFAEDRIVVDGIQAIQSPDDPGAVEKKLNAAIVLMAAAADTEPPVRDKDGDLFGFTEARDPCDELPPTTMFGQWETREASRIYRAETDGFITAYTGGDTPGEIMIELGETEADLLPRTRAGTYEGATTPVPRGTFWRVTVAESGSISVWWIPVMGS